MKIKKILHNSIASILLLAITLQVALFAVLPQEAHAQAQTGATATLGSVGGAAVGCAIGNLTGKIGNKIKNKTMSLKLVGVGDSTVQESTTAVKEKENCLDAIGYAAAKLVLKKVTLATVTWINTGFKGEPLFVKNPGSFFKSIADDEINSITGLLTGDALLYPFGKNLARSIILSTQATFAANAQYSLNKVLGNANAVRFQADFSAGGWDGWLAATQFLENNPTGAYIQAADEVTYRLEGTAQSNAQDVRDKLMQARGFLGLEKCVELNDGTAPGDKYDYDSSGYADTYPTTLNNNGQMVPDQSKKCKRYETITPGEAIAGQMNVTLGTPTHQLELADELNESLSAVFDALINQLFQKGLSSLSGNNSSSDIGVYGGYGNNSSVSTLGSIDTGLSDPDQWYNANPTFNIWKDLQPIIDLQIKYRSRLDDGDYIDDKGNTLPGENKILRDQLLPAIYELDFCVPGPNPLWLEDATNRIDNFNSNIPTNTKQESQFSQFLSNYSITHSVAVSLTSDTEEEKLDKLINHAISETFNTHSESDGNLNDVSKGIALVTRIFTEYRKKIQKKYAFIGGAMDYMLVSADLPAVYNQVPAYIQTIEDNQEAVDYQTSVINRLKFIQDKVKNIPEKPLKDLTVDQRDQIKVYLRTIGRLAPDLADDEIISRVDDDIYVLTDIRDYVAGPTGLLVQCKTELLKPENRDVKGLRAAYPTDLLPQATQDKYIGQYGGYFKAGYQDYGGSFLPGVYFGDYAGNEATATHVVPDLTQYFAVPLNQQLYGPGGNPTIFNGLPINFPTGTWTIQPPVDILHITDLVNIDGEANMSALEAYLNLY